MTADQRSREWPAESPTITLSRSGLRGRRINGRFSTKGTRAAPNAAPGATSFRAGTSGDVWPVSGLCLGRCPSGSSPRPDFPHSVGEGRPTMAVMADDYPEIP
jgi:hypothetical protein